MQITSRQHFTNLALLTDSNSFFKNLFVFFMKSFTSLAAAPRNFQILHKLVYDPVRG